MIFSLKFVGICLEDCFVLLFLCYSKCYDFHMTIFKIWLWTNYFVLPNVHYRLLQYLIQAFLERFSPQRVQYQTSGNKRTKKVIVRMRPHWIGRLCDHVSPLRKLIDKFHCKNSQHKHTSILIARRCRVYLFCCTLTWLMFVERAGS